MMKTHLISLAIHIYIKIDYMKGMVRNEKNKKYGFTHLIGECQTRKNRD